MERLDRLPRLFPGGIQTRPFISCDPSGGNASGFRFFRRHEKDGEWLALDFGRPVRKTTGNTPTIREIRVYDSKEGPEPGEAGIRQ